MSSFYFKYPFAFLFFAILLLQMSCDNKNTSNKPNTARLISTTNLPNVLDESSGLLYFDNQIWMLNDSGGEPHLYRINDEGELLQTTNIENAENVDWEDLAMDVNWIYVGDFGNNLGNRDDLGIYKISRTTFTQQPNSVVATEFIPFTYSDQIDFESNENHNFDCEAMITFNDDIYLFSKNRLDLRSKQYKLNNDNGVYSTSLIGSFDVGGLVTGADYYVDEGKLVLLVYNFLGDGDYEAFLWVFSDFVGDRFFEGSATRINLDIDSKAEGIVWKSGAEVFVSSEVGDGDFGLFYFFGIE